MRTPPIGRLGLRGAACMAVVFLGTVLTVRSGAAVTGTRRGAARPVGAALVLPAHGGEFLSPSKNISCEIDWEVRGIPSGAYCQTLSPARSVTISSSGHVTTCAGVRCLGNPAENAAVLPYLSAVGVGPFLCASRIDGMACSVGSRAFLLSRAGVASYAVLPHTTIALYAQPSSHPGVSKVTAYGWLLAIDRTGTYAEVEVACTHGVPGVARDREWTLDLRTVKAFEVDTDPADEASGEVVDVSRGSWVSAVRVEGWNGYLHLGADSYLTDGPGDFGC